jgi:hypothetical protein
MSIPIISDEELKHEIDVCLKSDPIDCPDVFKACKEKGQYSVVAHDCNKIIHRRVGRKKVIKSPGQFGGYKKTKRNRKKNRKTKRK